MAVIVVTQIQMYNHIADLYTVEPLLKDTSNNKDTVPQTSI